MNKKLFIQRGFIGIVLLIFFSYIILNYSAIEKVANDFLKTQIGVWGYFAIFASVLILELVPQPFFSSLFPLITGLVFNLNVIYLVSLVVVTSVIANYMAYFIGRHYGDSMAYYLISKKNYELSIKWFERHGMKIIAILALTPLPYFPVMGGIFKMTFKEFTYYAIIPRILNIIIFSFLIIWIL
jgi:uncharacterized membrane protein YdjX (TVP38/TMEM64 family)